MHEGKPGKESISQDLCVGIISNVKYEKDGKFFFKVVTRDCRLNQNSQGQ